MSQPKQISLGDPYSPGGAIYVARDREELLQMAIEYEILRLHQAEIPITPQLINLAQDRAKRELVLLDYKLLSLGVPQKIKTLLEFQKKSDVDKYCRQLEFTEFELYLLIHNCNQINFSHISRFEQYIPDHLEITDDDRKKLRQRDFRSFSNKLDNLLEFRKQSHVHLFERGSEWHLFYYNYSDLDDSDKAHWKSGSHLHYISHLWARYDKSDILKSFDQRKSNISGYHHIKFMPFEYPEEIDKTEIPISIFGYQPMLIILNSNLPADPILNPVPIAHVETRGVWISSISVV